MCAANVQFYERLKELQDKQHRDEARRLDLEQQFNGYVQSDHRLSKLKATKLQNYWRKVCDDEKRSLWRNEQLLKDLERIESHMETLSARTDKLRTMKRQYEDYVERMYPNWKEKVIQKQRLKQQFPVQNEQAAVPAGMSGYGSQGPGAGYVSLPGLQQRPYRISSTVPSMGNYDPANSSAAEFTTLPIPQDGDSPMSGGLSFPRHYGEEEEEDQRAFTGGEQLARGGRVRDEAPPAREKAATGGSTLQTVSSMPSELPERMGPGHGDQAHQQRISQHQGPASVAQAHPTSSSVPQQQQQHQHQHHRLEHSPRAAATEQQNAMYDADSSSLEDDNGGVNPVSGQVATPAKEQIAMLGGLAVPATHDDRAGQQYAVDEGREENTSDFGSDVSLPLSGEVEEPRSPVRSIPPPAVAAAAPARADRVKSPEVYPQPDITLECFYNMLNAIEGDLLSCESPGEFYQAEMPAESVKREIIMNASKNILMAHGSSVSMVVLDQLPLLVVNCEGGCLIPDKILFKLPAHTSEDLIKRHMHPTCHGFWDRLYEHFIELMRYNIMGASELAEVFAPLLISDDSPYETNAKALLAMLLEDVNPDMLKSPDTTSTFSTLSPRKSKTADAPDYRQPPETIEESPVHQHHRVPPIDVSANDDDDDDFFSQPVPKPQLNTQQLTQSAAYRQLLTGTQKTVSYEDSDDEEEDDIEAQLGSMVSPRRSQAKQGGHAKPEPEVETVAPAMPVKHADSATEKKQLSPKGAASKLSTASPGDAEGAHIPSAMDTGNTAISSTMSHGSTGRGAKNPGFRFGDSDTDEDIDIPVTGVGIVSKKDDNSKPAVDQDDFDFYD